MRRNAAHRPPGHRKELVMKKIYSRPVLAAHGRAAEQTKGRLAGDWYDFLGGYRFWFY